jgi:tRNA pseudouridine32 synthase/23S rRNA pseudouridine746 synthase
MKLIEYFSPQPQFRELPRRLRDPFDNHPHPLALMASDKLQQRLATDAHLHRLLHESEGGKMFGVLVVQDGAGRVGYLSAFSGMLDQQWQRPGFVPPLFDETAQRQFLVQGEARLQQLSHKISVLQDDSAYRQLLKDLQALQQRAEVDLAVLRQLHQRNRVVRRQQRNESADAALLPALSAQSQRDKRAYKKLKHLFEAQISALQQRLEEAFGEPIEQLKRQRKRLSRRLHLQIFDGYELHNFSGSSQALRDFFKHREPPGGSGDCAAPKLLQFAAMQQLKPLALAEFWYGAAASGTVRQHGRFYPPCRGKCHPVLPFMLQGIELEKAPPRCSGEHLQPQIIFEDNVLLVLNKPPGLLSVPGKEVEHSVQRWLQQRYPAATGPLLVHRLDMATSGLMLAAKTARAHKKLQRQFIRRSIQKRYVAVLSRVLAQQEYHIDLPLRVDLDDRPRQRVCEQYGKAAQTRVEVIARDASTTRVYFHPFTGRTHQLRVHAAHPRGLNAAIVGDELYGEAARRLYLHAERLCFEHPLTGKPVQFQLDADF